MFPGNFVATTPDKPAIVRPATGESLTYRQLDENSVRLAKYLRAAGLEPGDHIALISDNDLRVMEVYWAALRSGLYITVVNWHLTPSEAAYVVNDCGAKVLVASAGAATAIDTGTEAYPNVDRRLVYGGVLPGFDDYSEALAAFDTSPLESQPRGQDMLYSSGTTGRPKGIEPKLPEGQVQDVPDPYTAVFAPMYGFDADTVYLCPAPLYHAAPLRFCGTIQSVGGTVILMDRFEPEEALALIDRYRVTHSQWVPTMFVRMLKLPEEVRGRYDVSSLKVAIHAAAPCPPEIKRAMIEWWGPVVYEYYASTEGAGATFIDSQQALAHPGSVGRDGVMGIVHICDDEGRELPTGAVGTVWWEGDEHPFRYHNDPEKTRQATHPDHPTWTTSGDIGYLDEERYLYLTDRAAFTIISGGVNIYPQESENVLTLHPKVYDVAVIGVPNEEMGEEVKAVVQLADGVEPGPEVERELLDFVRERVSHFKAPRSIDFSDDLPRTPTGKLVKHKLRARYLTPAG
ncbi:AMP-binding protein [Rhodococcus ruber]|uniref:AMP-dependent synthetase n=1 Tax=Rhodococcus ruber TaxID=1830 RepID=A0A098BM88_9NOCA|nr:MULTISPECIES: AMP-binding protein [Rhodococcus]MBP2212426.1 fatty-acyl-CoA synthase [Rhodococcus ruber]MCD2126068.1 AMP-binding protein [Rhodococcus ruber]MCZ4502122.1 AMP-binding protein [Rhodococcus ruber]MCZ4532790.1 AMP-binding protein [Rhodococcus ruber]MCZ4620263.1 AMP-binding protein [Rhodococcus ruber]